MQRCFTSTCALIACLICSALHAQELTLTLTQVQGAAWRAENIDITFALGSRPHAGAHVGLVKLPGEQALRDVDIDCNKLSVTTQRIECPRAIVRGSIASLGKQTLEGGLVYERETGALQMRLSGIRLKNGGAVLAGRFANAGWSVELTLKDAEIGPLLSMLRAWIPTLPSADIQGTASTQLIASGNGARVQRVSWNGAVHDVTGSNASGTLAADKLSVQSSGSLQRMRDAWHFNAHIHSTRGQTYTEPVFLDFAAQSLRATISGRLLQDVVEVDDVAIEHAATLRARARATFRTRPVSLVSGFATIDEMRFPNAYVSYLQPYIANATFKALSTSGSLAGRFEVDARGPSSVDLTIDNVTAAAPRSVFGVSTLHGSIHWRAANSPPTEPSHLEWQRGSLFNLDIGKARLDFQTQGAGMTLSQAATVPVLDGALKITRLDARQLGSSDMRLNVDAELLPIDVERLCVAFGWPPFGGQLAGKISNLTLERNVMTLPTPLDAHVFDGHVQLTGMRLEDVFGKWPRFSADIGLERLDLEQVTQAFSFGRISGRLSGHVSDLKLFDWLPVSFDAELHTPADDRSTHRISQRAVATISSIGGSGASVAKALSSGFLRFFQDFGYDRLGWSCHLQNEVCIMSGIEPIESGGYYIVKGSGLPRIDVIGNAEQVDWPRLVSQLRAAMQAQRAEVR